jgi:hypothetical protein
MILPHWLPTHISFFSTSFCSSSYRLYLFKMGPSSSTNDDMDNVVVVDVNMVDDVDT